MLRERLLVRGLRRGGWRARGGIDRFGGGLSGQPVSYTHLTYVYSLGSPGSLPARIAEAIGAAFISADEITVDAAAAILGSIDLVYEAVGAAQVSLEFLYRLAPNGTYVFTGVPRDQNLEPIHSNHVITNLVLRNQAIVGVVNAGAEAFKRCV